MAESYREMEERHAILDTQMYQQEYADRWAGQGDDVLVAELDPATVRDCANCRYSNGDWCRAYCRPISVGCSGWAWDPKDEAAA